MKKRFYLIFILFLLFIFPVFAFAEDTMHYENIVYSEGGDTVFQFDLKVKNNSQPNYEFSEIYTQFGGVGNKSFYIDLEFILPPFPYAFILEKKDNTYHMKAIYNAKDLDRIKLSDDDEVYTATNLFQCEIGDYLAYFYKTGKIAYIISDWPDTSLAGSDINHTVTYISEISPTEKLECPASNEAHVVEEDSGDRISIIKDEVSTEEVTDNTTSNSTPNYCFDIITETDCKAAEVQYGFSCVWEDNESSSNGGFCSVDGLTYVACGDATDIPSFIPSLVSMCINLLKIATPLILIITSIISLVKALAAQKEDEMKKATSTLVRKIIAAVMVFFVIGIVQFVIAKVADSRRTSKINGETEVNNFSTCLDCFLNNSCSNNIYYKTTAGDTNYCTKLSNNGTSECK